LRTVSVTLQTDDQPSSVGYTVPGPISTGSPPSGVMVPAPFTNTISSL